MTETPSVLPAPLTPADLDLRDLPSMMLDVQRLRDSDITLLAPAESFRAAVVLWCVAWHQVPAASLPGDDRALCNFIGLGRDLAAWEAIKADALHGFVKCSDGRFYHPVIAEKAIEANYQRKAHRDRSAAGGRRSAAARRDAVRAQLRGSQVEPPLEPPLGAEVAPPVEPPVQAPLAAPVQAQLKQGKVREGKVRKEEEEESKTSHSLSGTAREATRDLVVFEEYSQPWKDLAVWIIRAFEKANNPNTPNPWGFIPIWRETGYHPKTICAVIESGLSKKRDVQTLAYFDRQIFEASKKAGEVQVMRTVAAPDTDWSRELDNYERGLSWPTSMGPRPSAGGTRVPDELLIARRYRHADGSMPGPRETDERGRIMPVRPKVDAQRISA